MIRVTNPMLLAELACDARPFFSEALPYGPATHRPLRRRVRPPTNSEGPLLKPRRGSVSGSRPALVALPVVEQRLLHAEGPGAHDRPMHVPAEPQSRRAPELAQG